MNKRITNLILPVVFILVLVGIFLSISQACTFVGVIRNPDPAYEFNQAQIYDDFLYYLPLTTWLEQPDSTTVRITMRISY